MKKILFIFSFLIAALSSQAQYYFGPYTPHAPISLNGVNNQTIRGYDITCGTGNGIYLYKCSNIHITKSYFHDGSTVNGVAIYALNCTNITVDSCYFYNTATGLEAQACVTVKYLYNRDLDMMGPYPRGQAVQFNNVSGSGNQIMYNVSWAEPGKSNYEDHINVYKSNGTSSSPILVEYNIIYGGGPSTTGSGITVADNGGSYQTILHNIVVNSGNVGMQVAGGTFINMSNNMIYSKATSISHLGLGYGNFSGLPSNNVTMGGNIINWRSGKSTDLAYYPKGTLYIQKDTSHSYKSGPTQVPIPYSWASNTVKANIDSTIETFPLWAPSVIAPVISYGISSASFTYGSAISMLSPVNSGSPATSFTISPALPAGLSFNITNGNITGTPAAAGSAVSYTITAYNSAGANSVTLTIAVNKAVLKVIPDNKSRLINTANPTLTVHYQGFAFNDGPSSLTAVPTLSTTALTNSAAGGYNISASGGSAANYTITYGSGTLTIYPAQRIRRRRVHY